MNIKTFLLGAILATAGNAMAQQSAEQAEEYIRGNLTNDRHVVIAQKGTDAFVGMIFIEEDSLRYKANSLEVSYWLGEPYSAQGIMTEALGAVVQHLQVGGGQAYMVPCRIHAFPSGGQNRLPALQYGTKVAAQQVFRRKAVRIRRR